MDLKGKGNEAFKAGNMDDAIVLFTEAIAEDEGNSVLFCNRAMAFAGLDRFEESVMDAREAVRLNPKYSKAYYRLVKGLMQLGRLREARQFLLVAYQECESDKDFRSLDGELETLSECPLRPRPGDFDIVDEIGDGNFSKIYKASLKKSKKIFAIKVIEVQTVERMKRRHRNINNEIMMEKKVLSKLNHANVVTLYSTFKDFGSLYYQMEFLAGGEVWALLKDDDVNLHGEGDGGRACLVGIPRSRARFLMMEAINGLEYMHRCGVVHRDIKPENMLLTSSGHLKLVDFGTAKDLLDTSLNGPEFVGTPEYMAPSAVNSVVSGPEADLWALGVVLYQMMTGFTPFASTSPYLSFLRIKRAFLRRPAFASDTEWAVVEALLTKDPVQRLANCAGLGTAANFRSVIGGKQPRQAMDEGKISTDPAPLASKAQSTRTCAPEAVQTLNYDVLRSMPFFKEDASLTLVSGDASDGVGGAEQTLAALKTLHLRPAITSATPIEQARRIIARAAVTAAGKIADVGGVTSAIPEDSEDAWVRTFSLVPGATAFQPCKEDDGTTLEVTEEDRAYVLHYLHRRNQLNVPGLYRLFWPSLVDCKCVRTDVTTMDYHSHTFKQHGVWPEKEQGQPFYFCHLASARMGSHMSGSSGGGSGEVDLHDRCEAEIASLKAAVTNINRLRPKFVVACGPFTDSVHGQGALYPAQTKLFRNSICRVSDSISLLFVPSAHEMGVSTHAHAGATPTAQAIREYRSLYGLDFFGFWYQGVRCLVVNSSLFWVDTGPEAEAEILEDGCVEKEVLVHARRQEQWLSEEIDTSKLCSVQIMLFSYHQWYHSQADEDATASSSTVVPSSVRLKWMCRLQHAKVKAVVAFASGSDTVEKRRLSAFPDAPRDARRAEQEKIERRRAKRALKQQKQRASMGKEDGDYPVEDAGALSPAADESERGGTPDSKRRDSKPTPVKVADADTEDMVGGSGDPLRPSQVIAEAVKSGEIKARHTHTHQGLPPAPAGDDMVQGGSFGPVPPISPVGGEDSNTDDDSDNNYSSDDDSDLASGGEEAEHQDDREPGFANVDKTLAGPDQILTGGSGGDLHTLSATLFKVTEEKVKAVHLPPPEIPREAPLKGWT